MRRQNGPHALGLATIITTIYSYLQIVLLKDGVNMEGMIVLFLISAFFIYVKFGNRSQPRA